MKLHGTIVCIAVTLIMSLTAGAASAVDILGAFLDESGMPLDHVLAQTGEPVTLDFGISAFDPAIMQSYLLDFNLNPEIVLIDWVDATGGFSICLNEMRAVIGQRIPPTPLAPSENPLGDFLPLGSLTFYNASDDPVWLDITNFGDPSYGSNINDGSTSHPIFQIVPLVIGPAVGPVVSISDPPPVPDDYQMGTIVNGDFEANGGSLDGWSGSGYINSSVTTQTLSNGHTDTAARLHAEGEWYDDPMMMDRMYEGGYCTLSQEIFIPVDADELTFTYATQEQILLSSGDSTATVWLGSDWSDRQTLDYTENWSTYTLSIPEEMRGRRQRLRFTASEYGWEDGYLSEELHNSFDFYVDYVGINGTTVLQTTTWIAGGGQWGSAGNWDPAVVPNNSTTTAHDVVVPETSLAGAITVAAPRTIQSLVYERTSGPLEIESGGSLHVVEFMTVRGGTLNIHPGGSATGGNPLFVEGPLRLEESTAGQPSTMSILDAIVAAGSVVINDGSTLTLGRSAGFPGETRLETSGSVDLSGGSHLQLGPGSAIAAAGLSLSSSSSMDITDANITRVSPSGSSSTSNYGTSSFSGNCLVDQNSFANRGTVEFNNANVEFTGTLSHNYASDQMSFVNSTVTAMDFSVGSTAESLIVDENSVLRVKRDFFNDCNAAAEFNFDAGSLVFTSAEDSDLWVQGMNQGPFSFGLVENFGFGNLALEEGDLTLRQNGSGHAQYVQDLFIAPGSTLDLNGVSLYCVGDFVNNGQVIGGEVRQAYQQPDGLPAPGIASYSISAMANDTTDSATDAPLDIEGWRDPAWWEECYWESSHAQASGSIENEADCCRLNLDISGQTGYAEDQMMMIVEEVPAEASVEMSAFFSVVADGEFTEGSAVELLILTALCGNPDDWGIEIYRGEDLIAAFSSGVSEMTIDATVGESLRIEAWLEDYEESAWSGFDSSLGVSIYTLSAVPEPGMATLLGLALLALALRFPVARR